jgi:hypothetical protein
MEGCANIGIVGQVPQVPGSVVDIHMQVMNCFSEGQHMWGVREAGQGGEIEL